jgi:hypothetical protein
MNTNMPNAKLKLILGGRLFDTFCSEVNVSTVKRPEPKGLSTPVRTPHREIRTLVLLLRS